MGRQAAGEQFLKAWVRHSGATVLPCVSPTKKEYEDFVARTQPWLPPGKSTRWSFWPSRPTRSKYCWSLMAMSSVGEAEWAWSIMPP